MKSYPILLFLTLLAVACHESKPPRVQKPESEVLVFLRSQNYKYYGPEDKTRIPKEIVDSLSSYTNGLFTVGDLQNPAQNKKFNFLLLNDSLYLLSYTESGASQHDVIDFLQYKGAYKHARYNATDQLSDTSRLKKFLLENPI